MTSVYIRQQDTIGYKRGKRRIKMHNLIGSPYNYKNPMRPSVLFILFNFFLVKSITYYLIYHVSYYILFYLMFLSRRG